MMTAMFRDGPLDGRRAALLRRHPLTSFFVLAYGVSWLGWTPYLLSLDGFGLLPLRFPELLGSTQLVGVLPGAYAGPLAAAFLVTAVTEGSAGLRRWRGRLLRFRVGRVWYLLVLVGLPAVLLLGTLPLPGAVAALRAPAPGLLLSYLPLLALQVITTGLAEEPGWRDFALVRLQQRHHPLVATLLLGVLWAGWHLPLFVTSWAGPTFSPPALAQFVLLAVVLSVIITWVFNRTGQSLPMVMLLHATFNAFAAAGWPAFFPGSDPRWTWGVVLGPIALALVLIVVTRGRLGCIAAGRALAPAQPGPVRKAPGLDPNG
jgi:membrane protease YdiL (CAAX protease family)